MTDIDLKCWRCKRTWKGPLAKGVERARRQDWFWSECEFCIKGSAKEPLPDFEPTEVHPTADEDFPYA